MATSQQQAEAIALLVLPDGLAETLRGNVQSQFGVDINPVVMQMVVELLRQSLVLKILSLIDSSGVSRSGHDRTHEPESRF